MADQRWLSLCIWRNRGTIRSTNMGSRPFSQLNISIFPSFVPKQLAYRDHDRGQISPRSYNPDFGSCVPGGGTRAALLNTPLRESD